MLKNKFIVLLIVLLSSSCEAPTTITARGLNSDTEKERIIMQGIALETYYNRIEKLLLLDEFLYLNLHLYDCNKFYY